MVVMVGREVVFAIMVVVSMYTITEEAVSGGEKRQNAEFELKSLYFFSVTIQICPTREFIVIQSREKQAIFSLKCHLKRRQVKGDGLNLLV